MELSVGDVKRKWIKSWKVMLGYQIVAGVIFLLLGSMCDWEGGDGENATSGVLLSLWAIFWLFLCRKCAYEKPGTKLLTFVLVSSALSIFRNFSELMKNNFDIYDIVDIAIYMPFFVWFVIASLDLRGINKKIQGKNKEIRSETDNSTGKRNVYN